MFQHAIGLVETLGLIASIEAADAMAKAADVEVLGTHSSGGGIHTVLVRGSVGAVKAATDAGVRAARMVGEVLGVHVIPRPYDETTGIYPAHRDFHG